MSIVKIRISRLAPLALIALLPACAQKSIVELEPQRPPPPPELMDPPPGPYLPNAQADIETWLEKLTSSAQSS